jgi:hypothetical protein
MGEESGWTLATLKTYFDRRFTDSSELQSERGTAQQHALEKLAIETESKFLKVNEFRGAMGDQQKTFIAAATVDAIMVGVNAKLADLSDRMTALQGRGVGMSNAWSYLIAALGAVAILWGLFVPHAK